MRFRQHQDRARDTTRQLLWLFVLTVVLTLVVLNGALALVWLLSVRGRIGWPPWFFETNTVVALGFILGGCWLETRRLREGGARVALQLGGREVLEGVGDLERRLVNVSAELAVAAGLKAPRLFILPREESINAFAAGWDQHDSVVAVTRGALERLTRDELQGVLAHEFGHIVGGDTRLNMRLIGYVHGLQLIFLFGRSLAHAEDERSHGRTFSLFGLALMAAGSLGWMAGRLLRAAVSRQREFLADAAAIQYTRLPEGLGGALRKIAGQSPAQATLRHARAETVSHMLLDDSLFGHSALATHPPLAERLRRLYGRTMPGVAAPVLTPAPASAAVGPPDLPPLEAIETAGAAALLSASIPESAPPAAPSPLAAAGWIDTLLTQDGGGELPASVLAFMVSPDSMPEAQAWQQATRLPAMASPPSDPAPAPHPLLQRCWALPPALRQPAFERLINRCQALPAPQRAQLRQGALAIARADGRLTLPELWRCLVLDAMLAHRPAPLVREPARQSLAQGAESIAAVTRVLARSRFGADTAARARRLAWRNQVLARLALDPTTAAGELTGTAELVRAVAGLRRLGWSQRPQLVRAWCERQIGDDEPWPLAHADALRSLCLLIDTPLPPALAVRDVPDGDPRTAMAA